MVTAGSDLREFLMVNVRLISMTYFAVNGKSVNICLCWYLLADGRSKYAFHKVKLYWFTIYNILNSYDLSMLITLTVLCIKWCTGNLASMYYEQGQLDMAILHYKQAVACDPRFLEAYNNLVDFLVLTEFCFRNLNMFICNCIIFSLIFLPICRAMH